MKKLLVLAAVCAMASISQAYSVTWGCLNVKTPSATDPKVDQTGIVGAGVSMENLAINLFWVNKAGADVAIGTFYTGTGTGAGKSTNNDLGDSASKLYQDMVANQGDSWKPVYHMTATYSTADGVYTFDGTVTAGAALGNITSKNIAANANFSTAGTWSYTANVPEPTSGLLMLLGVAGLALRRRRA